MHAFRWWCPRCWLALIQTVRALLKVPHIGSAPLVIVGTLSQHGASLSLIAQNLVGHPKLTPTQIRWNYENSLKKYLLDTLPVWQPFKEM